VFISRNSDLPSLKAAAAFFDEAHTSWTQPPRLSCALRYPSESWTALVCSVPSHPCYSSPRPRSVMSSTQPLFDGDTEVENSEASPTASDEGRSAISTPAQKPPNPYHQQLESIIPTERRRTGRCAFFIAKKGYGFIRDDRESDLDWRGRDDSSQPLDGMPSSSRISVPFLTLFDKFSCILNQSLRNQRLSKVSLRWRTVRSLDRS
jgi:hypothetical protein